MIKKLKIGLLTFFALTVLWIYFSGPEKKNSDHIPTSFVERRSFAIDVKTTGELEAAHSTIVASTIKGDLGKIINIVPDGVNIEKGQVLVHLDPTPFEEKVGKITSQIKEQEAHVESLKHALEWESDQCEHELKTAEYEIESCELELERILNGDGPQEISRLKGAMQKAWCRYDELNAYSNDLISLQEEGFLNAMEIKQAQKKLIDEQEAYEMAKIQYESYVNHVHPMHVKKGQASIKRANLNFEETCKSGIYKVSKAQAQLLQSQQLLKDYKSQLAESLRELEQAEIVAPAPGMVVLREEYRSGQKRKARIGDVLVKNQPLIDLPDLSSMMIKTKVREIDLFKIGIGKEVTIQVDAYPQLIFTGKVISIGVLAISDLFRSSDEKFFEVRILLDSSDSRLRPGMTTRNTIHANQVEDSLAIPVHAVFGDQKHNYCYQKKDNNYEKIEVKTGWSNEQWVEVLSGLDEGDCIYLYNPHTAE